MPGVCRRDSRDRGLVDTATFEPDLLGGVTVLETDALAYESGHGSGPGLYRELPSAAPRTFRLRLIPYCAWNNRGTPRMTVWIPVS